MQLQCFIMICLFGLTTLVNTKIPSISCKDEHGNNVDWFYVYKLPEVKFPQHSLGVEFIFMTPKSPQWHRSNKTIDRLDSLIGNTIAQAYTLNNHPNRVVLAYNDEPPNEKADSTKGHTKGVVVADADSGIWVVHSVPKYPFISENPNNYTYPLNGYMYAQSFLCISLPSSEVDNIGLQLLYNEPHVYEFKISDNLRNSYPNLIRVADNARIKKPPFWNRLTITSINGVAFETFAKGRSFHKELYEDWVAPTLQTDLYVESWIHGSGVIPSNCTLQTHVWNVNEIKMSFIGYEFSSMNDHSKWAVAANHTNWICVGDINRAKHQKMRGGGTVCQDSLAIAQQYRSLVNAFEPCSL